MSKPAILFLCHRIPYPPNKGDKIRSFNMLLVLQQEFDVHLGCFVDDAFDLQYIDQLQQWCASVCALPMNKKWSTVKSVTGLLTGQALSVPYYHREKMQHWVDQTCASANIKQALVFSSTMAQYILSKPDLHTVVDFVDVDSDKWLQYAVKANPIKKWVYKREWRTLRRFERTITHNTQHSLFVSPQEAELYKKQIPDSEHHKVGFLLNGVDSEYFDSNNADIKPIDVDIDVSFTGAMDYWANINSVLWFSQNVWPVVRRKYPNATFYVVGGNPSAKIQALNGLNGITVTGRVGDVRPFILQSKVTVAPLQIARGIQNKILEAMSLAKPIVCTEMAMEGIEVTNESIVATNDPSNFADAVCHFIECPEPANASRSWVTNNLNWQETLSILFQFLALNANKTRAEK
ncbi:TIGR03087 family PEP-CTERM/XrtA system glycosyltransferase [Alteromonadaceae bacterium BrNp21-10]|nr:TIGR03087 family PEP-CTERM/XrtA system glycosyltransferase [Alteromonadaceae bacterium BrNp21-10]